MRPNLTYDDLDLKILKGDGQVYQVNILYSTWGENETPVEVHFDLRSEPFSTWIDQWQNGVITQQDLIALGQRLMGFLIPEGQIRSLFENARGGNHSLRIRLRLAERELQALPWEFAYDETAGDFLILDPRISLVRYLEMRAAPRDEIRSNQINILALVSLMPGIPHLQVVTEVQNLLVVLDELLAQDLVKVNFLIGTSDAVRQEIESLLSEKKGVTLLPGCASLPRLQEVLRDDYWILHYIGHADYSQDEGGYILLSKEDGTIDEVDALTFSRHLRNSKIEIAVLNACRTAVQGGGVAFKGIAQRLVQSGLPAVVAMQSLITDLNALAFSRAMFGALAKQYPLDSAVTEGRVAIAATRIGMPGEFAVPVLFLRSTKSVVWNKEEPSSLDEVQKQSNPGGVGIIIQGDPTFIGPVIPGTVQGNINYEYIDRRGHDQNQPVRLENGGQDQADLEPRLLFEAIMIEFRHLDLSDSKRVLGSAYLDALRRELFGKDVDPSATEIVTAGNWLLENAPSLSGRLSELFQHPTIFRRINKAGSPAAAWMMGRFYQR